MIESFQDYKTATDIGYGLRLNYPLEQSGVNPAHEGKHGKLTPTRFDEHTTAVGEYHSRQSSTKVRRTRSEFGAARCMTLPILIPAARRAA